MKVRRMDMLFFLTSFGLGIAAAAALGPIFILTFNRAATLGLFAGVVTGWGAALVDAIYFFIGLSSALHVLSWGEQWASVIQLVGGLAVMFSGYSLYAKRPSVSRKDAHDRGGYVSYLLHAFILTLLNPMVIAFFIAATMRMLASLSHAPTLFQKCVGSFFLFAGSASVTTGISIVGFVMGKNLKVKTLDLLSIISSFIITSIGFLASASALKILLLAP